MSGYNLFEHYEEASALLSSLDVMASPAELHGVLCGLLCGGAPVAKSLWLHEFNDLVNDGAPLPEGVTSWLRELFAETIAGLTQERSLVLLLPDDDEGLEERLLATAEWAQAFLAGFAVMQRELNKVSEELQEMLGDISQITQIDQELEENVSETEADYIVIYEHLKLGAMMAFEECGDRASSSSSTAPTLH